MNDILLQQIIQVLEPFKVDDALKETLTDLLNQYEIKKVSSGNNHPDLIQKLKLFLMSKKMEGLSDRTIKKYQKILNGIGSYLHKPVNQITTGDIRNWLSTHPNIKMSTIKYYISVLRSFFDYLITEELISVDPTRKIKLPKLEQRIPKALSIDEMELLREGCITQREKALLEIFYASGCRLSEIHALNKADINWQERSFNVVGKGNKERVVFIGARAAHALRKYLNSRKDNEKALFVTEKGSTMRLSQRSIHLIFKKIASRVAINKNIHPHVFRHTMATAMINHGARIEDVQSLLGHSSPNTTQVYARVSFERKKQAYNQHFIN